jgi:hypothetical protein
MKVIFKKKVKSGEMVRCWLRRFSTGKLFWRPARRTIIPDIELTTKRGKSEKWNDFFKRDLTEIIRALNSKNEFFSLDTLLETAKNLLEFTGDRTTLYFCIKY